MAQPQRTYAVGSFPVSRLLMLVACVLFVIAALIAGAVLDSGGSYIPWVLGGFAAVALSWAVP